MIQKILSGRNLKLRKYLISHSKAKLWWGGGGVGFSPEVQLKVTKHVGGRYTSIHIHGFF